MMEDPDPEAWSPLRERRPLAERAAEFLTSRILAGEWETGDYLPTEPDLCARLGVGRSTIREAIRVLELRGLVRSQHGVGVEVVDNSQQAASNLLNLVLAYRRTPLEQVIEARNAIESQAALLAVHRADEADLAAMRKALRQMEDPDISPLDYANADLAFHMSVAAASRNNVILLFLETIRPIIMNVIVKTLEADPRPEARLHYHRAILTALERRDPVEVEKAVASHMQGANALLKSVPEDWIAAPVTTGS